jgi:hypothetical protein
VCRLALRPCDQSHGTPADRPGQGLVLAVTPWLLSFATDRAARLDVMVGGAIVALLGIALIYVMQPEPTQRLSH